MFDFCHEEWSSCPKQHQRGGPAPCPFPNTKQGSSSRGTANLSENYHCDLNVVHLQAQSSPLPPVQVYDIHQTGVILTYSSTIVLWPSVGAKRTAVCWERWFSLRMHRCDEDKKPLWKQSSSLCFAKGCSQMAAGSDISWKLLRENAAKPTLRTPG